MSDLMPRAISGLGLLIVLAMFFYSGYLPTLTALHIISIFVFLEVCRVSFGGHYAYNPFKILIPNSILLALFIYSYVTFSQYQVLSVLVALTMFSVSMADVAAYFTGRFFGKSLGEKLFGDKYLLAPKTSPKKTKVGAIGGLLFGTISFAAGLIILFEINYAVAFLIGIVCIAVSIAGDLLESKAKRSVGEKDSGSRFTRALLKGHGGFWDRFDSHIPALIVALSACDLLVLNLAVVID